MINMYQHVLASESRQQGKMTLDVWQHIRQEAKELAENEPMLASFFHSTIF